MPYLYGVEYQKLKYTLYLSLKNTAYEYCLGIKKNI